MTDQIERVARAIYEAAPTKVGLGRNNPLLPWSQIGCLEGLQAQLMAQARAAISAASEWLPIESAPKDGTRVIGCVFDAKDLYHRKPEDRQIVTMAFLLGEWICDPNEASEYGPDVLAPIAWQPLPQPPKVTP